MRWLRSLSCFHLKAANGEIIAASQGYETKANAEKGIGSVKTNAPDAKVVDLTERHRRRTPRTCCACASSSLPLVQSQYRAPAFMQVGGNFLPCVVGPRAHNMPNGDEAGSLTHRGDC